MRREGENVKERGKNNRRSWKERAGSRKWAQQDLQRSPGRTTEKEGEEKVVRTEEAGRP